jgi:hypothetical protein
MSPAVLGAVLLLAILLGACADDDRDVPAGAGGDPIASRDPGPRPNPLPLLDRSRRVVELGDVHFDMFDGRSVPLTEAWPGLVDSLLDVIPPLHYPAYDDVSGGDWLDPADAVIGYEEGGLAIAYPLKILNFHEIVNDEIGGIPILVSYCPLCRSGVVYDRRLGDRVLTFGNTSALYESDMVMYDWETNTYWWQVAGLAIVGTLTGERLEPLPAVTTTWREWRALHPDTLVLSRDTGYARNYEWDPFAGYTEVVDARRFRFPVSEAADDPRLGPSEVVLGIAADGDHVAVPLRRWGDAAVPVSVGGRPVVVFTRSEGPSGNAFSPVVDGRALTFSFRDGAFVDEETGSRWNLSGIATSGQLQGRRMEALPSRSSFWFAYVAAFPDIRVALP